MAGLLDMLKALASGEDPSPAQAKPWNGWQQLRASDNVEYAPNVDWSKEGPATPYRDVVNRRVRLTQPADLASKAPSVDAAHIIDMLLKGQNPVGPYDFGFAGGLNDPFLSDPAGIRPGFPTGNPGGESWLEDWPVPPSKKGKRS